MSICVQDASRNFRCQSLTHTLCPSRGETPQSKARAPGAFNVPEFPLPHTPFSFPLLLRTACFVARSAFGSPCRNSDSVCSSLPTQSGAARECDHAGSNRGETGNQRGEEEEGRERRNIKKKKELRDNEKSK